MQKLDSRLDGGPGPGIGGLRRRLVIAGGVGGRQAGGKVVQAIRDARIAVRALGGSAYTESDFENARTAIAAARKALADADELSDSATADLADDIESLDELLAAARTRAGVEARKLTAAMSGTRITAIGAALEHGEAPRMSGTAPGSAATTVSGLETAWPPAAHRR